MRRLLAAAMLLVAAACGPSVTSGTVVQKDHRPASNEVRYEYTCDPVGFGGSSGEMCDFKFHTVHVSERWWLTLRQCGGEDGCRTGTVSVSAETFLQYEVGEEYP